MRVLNIDMEKNTTTKPLNQNKMKQKQKQINMKTTEKRNLDYLQLLESLEVMLMNGNSINPDSVIRGAIQLAIGKNMEIKAENLVDDFVKQWREKNNTEDAVYSAYHYDAMIAFAEYFKELNKSE